jgi:hypothetical protein
MKRNAVRKFRHDDEPHGVLAPRVRCHKGFTEVEPASCAVPASAHRGLAEIQADTCSHESGNFVTQSRCFDLAYTSRARLMAAPTGIE